jgi:drug/metabolite transporter (DMT)-like permease
MQGHQQNHHTLTACATEASEASIHRAWLPPLDLICLAAIWGASYLFMRLAAKDIGSLAMVEIRSALGSLILLPYLWRSRALFPARLWPQLALIGTINSAIPFLLFAWAAHSAPAGIGAITSAMTVMFAALVGHVFYREAISRRHAAAMLAGFAGVVLLANSKVAGAHIAWAVAAGVTASLLYGIGLHLVRQRLGGLPPAAVASATLGMSALFALPFAIAQWPQARISFTSWAAAAMLGIVCTGIAYVLYYRLVARIGPRRTSTVTYLIPVFGTGWGWWLLGEPLTLAMGLAGILILGGIAMIQRA